MKQFLLCGLCLLGAIATEAAPIKLLSPDTAQTYAVGWLVDHTFTWNARTGQFGAYLVFNNRSATKGHEEESFRFVFPQVKFDTANRTFYAMAGPDQRVPVAQWRKGWLGAAIIPAPGTRVLIANEHGKVRLVLMADTAPPPRSALASCWIERSDAWVFQNLLRNAAGAN